MTQTASAVLVIIVFLTSGCFYASTEVEEMAEPDPKFLTGIPEVVDGDTVKIDGESIRLEGIDAPEKRQNCRDSEGETYPCGVVATEALAAEIGSDEVTCENEGRGYYGRIIGTCYMGSLDLNAWMVEQGHAVVNPRYDKRYLPEEEEAREAKRGVWQGEFVPPWEWRRGKRLPE